MQCQELFDPFIAVPVQSLRLSEELKLLVAPALPELTALTGRRAEWFCRRTHPFLGGASTSSGQWARAGRHRVVHHRTPTLRSTCSCTALASKNALRSAIMALESIFASPLLFTSLAILGPVWLTCRRASHCCTPASDWTSDV
jgi:hypothetical protein